MASFKLVLFSAFFLIILSSCSPIQYAGQSDDRFLTRIAAVAPKVKRVSYASTSIDSGSFLNFHNQHVSKWIDYYSVGKGRSSMLYVLEKSSRYKNSMVRILKKYNLPEDLFYVAMVESGFKSNALSKKGASGYWQFIPMTAKRFDLRIDNSVDERRDFILSTEAAAKYLSYLYSIFNDWPLALAAYNAGEGRIGSAVQSYSKNYWSLVDHKRIPQETADYVPKIIAMKEISKHPWKYDFDDIQYEEPLDYRSINIYKAFSIDNLSEVLNISKQSILKLNPKYKSDIAPLYKEKVQIRIPAHVSL